MLLEEDASAGETLVTMTAKEAEDAVKAKAEKRQPSVLWRSNLTVAHPPNKVAMIPALVAIISHGNGRLLQMSK